ncbi:acetyltransferase, GNAT family/GNAT family acetyltransferase [Golovinomyces cichoracearum]|uniref:Acetyltransferase, GNAT family/GNAT family acetyltransferase n=1 Tax=Golovinomyces cichoracearum TaxID=62708 RepID=A0A420J1H4_9PEZI|nr:acetyltransferase, GNAT family/GNAT family acetyltransferase [Golovinomyces cichoracearum]
MAEGSQNTSTDMTQNKNLSYLDGTYISHLLNWQKQIVPLSTSDDSKLKSLHPYTRPLTPRDLESCVVLENLAYADSGGSMSRKKLEYLLNRCGELCLGIFCTVVPGSNFQAETLSTSLPVETGRENGAVSVLLGHVIASMTSDIVAFTNYTKTPDDSSSPSPALTNVENHKDERNAVLQSIAVLPSFRCRGIGKTLILAFTDQMQGTGTLDQLSLLANKKKAAWCEKQKFRSLGPSNVLSGSGEKVEMVKDIQQLKSNTPPPGEGTIEDCL